MQRQGGWPRCYWIWPPARRAKRHIFRAARRFCAAARCFLAQTPPSRTRKPACDRRDALCFREQIQGPENASIARFDGLCCYQTSSKSNRGFGVQTAATPEGAAALRPRDQAVRCKLNDEPVMESGDNTGPLVSHPSFLKGNPHHGQQNHHRSRSQSHQTPARRRRAALGRWPKKQSGARLAHAQQKKCRQTPAPRLTTA